MLAVAATIAWGVVLATLHFADQAQLDLVAATDALRIAGWGGLVLLLLRPLAPPSLWRALLGTVAFAVVLLLLPAATRVTGQPIAAGHGILAILLGSIIGALAVLVLLEQLYRNADPGARWSLKYLCLGLGAVFAYDLFLYADSLLGRQLDTGFWSARGYVNALLAPLIAVSAARNPDWALDVYVSRRFVLHTATLAAAGVYLLLMAVVAYSIEVYGGAWAGPVQGVFLVGGLLVLLLLLFSGQIRARARVFVSKHFYNYRYDYREEWLRFSRTMTAEEGAAHPLPERAIQAVGQVVDSPAGVLWQRRDGRLEPVAGWNLQPPADAAEPADGELARFLVGREWVLTVDEWRTRPEHYDGIAMPAWLEAMPRAWLLVPLLHHDRLEGVVVLARSRAGATALNWEDFDLLKIIGRQVASHLAQESAAQALTRAQQFEAFNRMSTYVLHDLKNIIGQLSMLASNARRHGERPEFMRDAVETIEHAVERMNELMSQLRGGLKSDSATTIDLARIVQEAVQARSRAEPRPRAEVPEEPLRVRAERGRLGAIVANLIQNAQEACDDDDTVSVELATAGEDVTIDIVDTGSGMSAEFVRDRLFRPFDSSKGTTGMGIGAFEAREFMRELGGDVEIDSREGEGTRFRLRFPPAVRVDRQDSTAVEEGV
jgi:putative PEP-CTERM system histidine kinase